MTSNHPDSLSSPPIFRPGLKRIRAIAMTTNIIFGLMIFIGIYAMLSPPSVAHGIPFVIVTIIGFAGQILVLFCLSIIAKCPKCSKRVYTPKLWVDGAMPLRGKKECPFCMHPVDEDYTG